MRVSSLFAAVAVLAPVLGNKVACVMNGIEISVVDQETGICEFLIPRTLNVEFYFTNSTNFGACGYFYESDHGEKYYNDYYNSGRKLSVPVTSLSESPKSVDWVLAMAFEGVQPDFKVETAEELRDKLKTMEKVGELPNWDPMMLSVNKNPE